MILGKATIVQRYSCSKNFSNGKGGWRGVLPDFLFLFYLPCSANHNKQRNWPPCKVVFRVGNQHAKSEK